MRLAALLAAALLVACQRTEPSPQANAAPSSASAPAASASAASLVSAGSGSAVSSASPAPSGSAAADPARKLGKAPTYLPRDCPFGRLYVDVQRASALIGRKSEEDRKAFEASIQDPTAKRALAALRELGVDPLTDVLELAACASSPDLGVMAISFDASKLKGEPLATMEELAKKLGAPVKRDSAGGVDFLRVDKAAFAPVAPGVLTITPQPELLAQVREAAGKEGFQAAEGKVVYYDQNTKGQEIRVSVTEQGELLHLDGRVTPPGPMQKQIAKSPKLALAQVEQLLKMVEKKLAKTPLAPLAPKLAELKLGVEGGSITAALDVKAAELPAVVKLIAGTKQADLMPLFQ